MVRAGADAIGQISGGPVVGAIYNLVSVPAALVTSALILSPALPLHSLAVRRGEQQAAG